VQCYRTSLHAESPVFCLKDFGRASPWTAWERKTLVAITESLRRFRGKSTQLNLGGCWKSSCRHPSSGSHSDCIWESPWSNLVTYTVRGTVRLPILQGGRVEAEVSSADAVIRQTKEEIRSTKLHSAF
jgi:hypothetical protein